MINYINNIYHTILNMNIDEIITKNKLFIKKQEYFNWFRRTSKTKIYMP
jgi:hypothetical protein